MIKKLGMACLLLAFVCGCMDAKSVLDVKKDGSGTYTETVIVSKQTETMMAQMPGPGGPGGAKANPFANKEKAKKKATEMGCTFIGLKESKTAQGESCYTTTYSFTDINKVKVNFSNSGPQGPGGPGGPGAQPSAEEKAKEMTTFTFTKGSPAKLVIHGPKDEEDKKDKSASAGPADKSDSQFGAIAELEQQMAQMPPPVKALFETMQMEATIKVEGKISKTNASYQTKDKNGIILMKMHLGKLLKDKETMAKLKEIDKLDLSDEEKAKKAQKIMPDYMKVEPEKELSVEFN